MKAILMVMLLTLFMRLKQMAAQELQQALEKRPVVEGTIRPTPER
jgi:hypothetical protein